MLPLLRSRATSHFGTDYFDSTAPKLPHFAPMDGSLDHATVVDKKSRIAGSSGSSY